MQDIDPSTLSASINNSETLETWKRERSPEQLTSFVEAKLAAQALIDVTL